MPLAQLRVHQAPDKHLHHSITTCRNNKTTVLTPNNAAHTLSAHYAVAGNFLCTNAFFERPEPDRCIVAC